MAIYNEASAVFERTAVQLDIPETIAQRAVLEFERVALWLAEEDSPLRPYSPALYPQGSFRLGTPVRPRGSDEFDIDLVCLLEIKKENVTQSELKAMVGNRLRSNEEICERVNESRRCWTLSYNPEFHLDVLPCIPDLTGSATGILLTDSNLVRWQFSNPKGYANWFFDRMRQQLFEARSALASESNVRIEEVPEWRVRTPLQRAVQLLKRHRDVSFATNYERRPASIILTTLTARAYRQQPDLATSLIDLAEQMPAHIERRGGQWWVANPAHPNENFADKWNEDSQRREAFLRWLEALRADILAAANAASERDAQILVERRLGTSDLDSRGVGVDTAPLPPDDTSHARQPPWPELPRYRCEIEASVYPAYKRGNPLWPLARLVHKKAGILFRAVTDTPEPFEVRWQVTNTGAEARRARQLRGGFDDGEGRNGGLRWERTLYRGTHFIEAFVIKDGILVARSGRTAVRIPK